MIKMFRIGSSLNSENPNDYDFLVIADKPVDICLYTPEDWEDFMKTGLSDKGQRIVLYPRKEKGEKLLKKEEIAVCGPFISFASDKKGWC